jgi:hypothetical protein
MDREQGTKGIRERGKEDREYGKYSWHEIVVLNRIRIRIHMLLSLPDPDPLVGCMDLDPDLSIFFHKGVERPFFKFKNETRTKPS